MAKLQPHAVKLIKERVARYKDEPPTPTMMILEDIQKEYGYIPLEVQELVSDLTGVPVSEIYGVVTFYSFFSMTPKGKYVIGVCLGTACYVKGSQLVLDKFSELLGIKPGETSKDGLFTIDVLRCIGACALAPAVTINGKVYSQVQVDNVKNITLITTNCAVLGVVQANTDQGLSFLDSLANGIGTSIGFLLIIVTFSCIRSRLETNNVPKAFKGLPIALVVAAIMAIAFMGLQGLFNGINL